MMMISMKKFKNIIFNYINQTNIIKGKYLIKKQKFKN